MPIRIIKHEKVDSRRALAEAKTFAGAEREKLGG